MALKKNLLPEYLAFGAKGGKQYSTDITINRGGYEKRNQNWASPLGRWDIGYVHKNLTETTHLQAFFNIMGGRYHSFWFHDHKDGNLRRDTLQRLTSTTYQLRRKHVIKNNSLFINVLHPETQTLLIALGGDPIDAYTVDDSTGIVTFNSAVASNVTVTATGRYFLQVRFDSDTFDPEEVDQNLFSWPSVPLVEVRP